MTIDISTQEGQALLRQLVVQSDVLVENFKVGGLAAYGLDADSLRRLNPRLIYCSVTGFGQDGPYAERAGYDLMVQAMSGMMSVTGRPDGEPGAGPLRIGVALTDIFTGMYAVTAILAALQVRNRTGLGQNIDIALLDVGMAMLANQATSYLITGATPQRQGNTHPSLAPDQDFPTLDGSMLLAIGNNGQFARFSEAVGSPWKRQLRSGVTPAPPCAYVTGRRIIPDMEAITFGPGQPRSGLHCCRTRPFPAAPSAILPEAFADPQVKARGIHIELLRDANDGVRSLAGVASPLRLQDNPAARHAPPALGQHTQEVLAELGCNPTQIADLRARAYRALRVVRFERAATPPFAPRDGAANLRQAATGVPVA